MTEQTIVEYIKGQLAQGVPYGIIKTNLMQNGWLPSDIDLAFNSINKNMPVQNVPVSALAYASTSSPVGQQTKFSFFLNYFNVIKKYAVFDGRAQRAEYWCFFLVNIIIGIVAGIIEVVTGNYTTVFILTAIYALALIIPAIAMVVRRLHDTGKSGWWYFIMLVPAIGSIWFLILMCLDSNPGDNQYGPNPKGIGGSSSQTNTYSGVNQPSTVPKWVKVLLWIILIPVIVLVIVIIVIIVFIFIGMGKGIKNVSTSNFSNTSTQQTNVTSNSSWITYSPNDDSFSIMFPTDPTVNSQTAKTANGIGITTDIYMSHNTSEAFFVTKYIYSSPINVSNPDSILQEMLNSATNKPGRTLIKSDLTYSNSNRTLEFVLQDQTTSSTMSGQAILAGQTPYMIFMTYSTNSYNDADYQKFINSFQVSQSSTTTQPVSKDTVSKSGNTIPSDSDLIKLTNDTMLSFAQAVKDNDFSDFYSSISKLWQSHVTAQQLGNAFMSFTEKKVDFTPLSAVTPVFSGKPVIQDDGKLVVSGYYPYLGIKVNFALKYVYEDSNWKLDGINVLTTK